MKYHGKYGNALLGRIYTKLWRSFMKWEVLTAICFAILIAITIIDPLPFLTALQGLTR